MAMKKKHTGANFFWSSLPQSWERTEASYNDDDREEAEEERLLLVACRRHGPNWRFGAVLGRGESGCRTWHLPKCLPQRQKWPTWPPCSLTSERHPTLPHCTCFSPPMAPAPAPQSHLSLVWRPPLLLLPGSSLSLFVCTAPPLPAPPPTPSRRFLLRS